MQEMRFALEGTSNFGSTHGQSLDLIGSDDTKPELEGFVMQTDDEPTSIAGKGNSFDEWNLPSTTIEHASILEQLCQSACMQTPVACSSTSYKLHNIPDLYHSVPIGFLGYFRPSGPLDPSVGDGLRASNRGLESKTTAREDIIIRKTSACHEEQTILRGPLDHFIISGQTSLRKGGPSLSEQVPKRNNIVSSMNSFIPLVQQKQAAAVVTGKRDIKVKALEAAEAAKRLAEKKENERKMKKEALKLERSRMEHENMKQVELQKIKKEE